MESSLVGFGDLCGAGVGVENTGILLLEPALLNGPRELPSQVGARLGGPPL